MDGIYHFLWQKIAQKSCPNVSIPDTVVYKYRQPAYWYFMSVDGSIKMKAQKNIVNTPHRDPRPWTLAQGLDRSTYYGFPCEGPTETQGSGPGCRAQVNAKIFEAFSKQSKDAVTDIVAYYISPVEGPNGNTDKTTIEFFDVIGRARERGLGVSLESPGPLPGRDLETRIVASSVKRVPTYPVGPPG